MGIKKNIKAKIEIIIEKNDGLLWGRVENKGRFMPTPYGRNTIKLIANLKELIADYVQHEGRKDLFWSKLNMNELQIDFRYDLESFFQEHDYLKISSVAELAGMNPGLVRQYASGVKYPSSEQADKIRRAIKKIAKELTQHSIYLE
ncbi:MAG TPA: hypothetical protein VGG71_03115 [Chitinophagaceae bacterium]|jgi:hypothetical protein